MYGQTEATARIAYVPPERSAEKLGSAGIAIPGGRLRDRRRRRGAGASTGRRGRLRGPERHAGLRDDAARTSRAATSSAGVLRTGDIGYLDDDGFLFLVGRSKRIAKVFGLRVNLDEVEAVLRERRARRRSSAATTSIWAFCAFGTDESLAALPRALARRFRLHHSALRLRQVDAAPDDVAAARSTTSRCGDGPELTALLEARPVLAAAPRRSAACWPRPQRADRASPRATASRTRGCSTRSAGAGGADASLADVPYLPVVAVQVARARVGAEDDVFKVTDLERHDRAGAEPHLPRRRDGAPPDPGAGDAS